ALARSANHDSQILAAVVFARAGDLREAEKLANALVARYPRDTLVISYWLPVIRAAVELNRPDPAPALDDLHASTPYELARPDTWPGLSAPVYAIVLRGQARLALPQESEAAAEFQKLLDHRGLVRASPMGPLAHLGLANAYAHKGDTAKARAAYQDFFT